MIILQGLPGVGKTTLTKKIVTKLQETTLNVSGFYTEEIRDSRHYRIGFDIVTLDKKRATLARKSSEESEFKVGSYNVYIENFEQLALSVVDSVFIDGILVIDEIGKMELLSKKFECRIDHISKNINTKIIATMPLKGGGSLIQRLKNDIRHHLITVTPSNRDKLVDEIIALITV